MDSFLPFITTTNLIISFILLIINLLLFRKISKVVSEATVDERGGDILLEEARKIVLKEDKASATLLQRKLNIGYARSARLMDLLEEEGIIGSRNRG